MYVTKRTENLQMRYFIQKGDSLESFSFNGGDFKIIGISKYTDLLKSANPFWWACQYEAIEEGANEMIEVYVYYYHSFDRPELDCAIVDGIRPASESCSNKT